METPFRSESSSDYMRQFSGEQASPFICRELLRTIVRKGQKKTGRFAARFLGLRMIAAESERLDGRRQTTLVAGGGVLVDDLLVGNRIYHAL